jgi:hypothetical protein
MLSSLKAEASMKVADYESNLYRKLVTETEFNVVKNKISSGLAKDRHDIILYQEKVHPGVSYKRVLKKIIIEPETKSIMRKLKDNFPEFRFYYIKEEYKQGYYMELHVNVISLCTIF